MNCSLRGKGWIVAAAAVLIGGAGCQQIRDRFEPPEVRRARLIAAQYMELEKSLADLDAKIENLRTQYEQQIKEKEEQLAAYRQKVEGFQNDVQQAISERVNQVTATVLNENAKLRKEVESLRAQLEQRMGIGAQTSPNQPQAQP
jgi:chromosome segregation ATPase